MNLHTIFGIYMCEINADVCFITMTSNCPYRNKVGNCAGETYNYERPCDFALRNYKGCRIYLTILKLLSGGKAGDHIKHNG